MTSPKFYRTTISIPQDLKERMDAAGEQVNWSAVAARAFEAKLLDIELARKRGKMNKNDIVKRLKAARADDTEEYDDGKAEGRRWAAETAKPRELKRLAEYISRCDQDNLAWWDVDYSGWKAPFGAADYFVFALRPKCKDDRHALASFWEEALGGDADRIEDGDFLRGFGEGADEVWGDVAGEL
jgi:hypothetical protein